MLKFLGVGMSRTGTKSLAEAMRILGFVSVHWYGDEVGKHPWPYRLSRIVMGLDNTPNFRGLYDDCDFANDVPHCYYYREIGEAYPTIKYILTVRDEAAWFASMKKHYAKIPRYLAMNRQALNETRTIQHLLHGPGGFNALPEFNYRKRYRDWNDTIRLTIPAERLLVLDITDQNADKWRALCEFVGQPVPDAPFPWKK